MYVDRHALRALVHYSAAETVEEGELRKWLTVLVDKATDEARDEFSSAVSNGDYPHNAVTPLPQPKNGGSLAITKAPPALILILGESVDPDTRDPRNDVPKELEETLKVALASWDTAKLESQIADTGWLAPVDTPDIPGPEDVPQDAQDAPQDAPQDAQDAPGDVPANDDPEDTQETPAPNDSTPVEEAHSLRKKVFIATGVVAAGLAVWMWRRRSRS